jgi:large subunit ribosomal protein L34
VVGDKLTFNPLAGKILIELIKDNKMSVTYKPKSAKRKKTQGFLKRNSTTNGKAVLKRRRQKGRKKISL